MSVPFVAPSGAAPRRLVIETEPETNALLRVLEPFVIHNVLPARVDAECPGEAGAVRITVHFDAPDALAQRLEARISTLVCVREARLSGGWGASRPVDAAA
ncbi:MAG: hypothetical protein AB1592_15370 [Pseudomonadota bacterium]